MFGLGNSPFGKAYGGLTKALGPTGQALVDPLGIWNDQSGGGPGADYSPWMGVGGIEGAAGAKYPTFQSIRDEKGNLLPQYQLTPDQAGPAATKLSQEALSQGPTDWAKALNAQEQQAETLQGSRAGAQSQAAEQGALADIARTGGVSTGARTSIARSGARDLLNAKQNVAGQGAQTRLGITSQDQALKQGLLGTEAGAEQEAQKGNIGNTLGDIQSQRGFDVNRYNQIMAAYGANQAANAQARAGQAGGGKK